MIYAVQFFNVGLIVDRRPKLSSEGVWQHWLTDITGLSAVLDIPLLTGYFMVYGHWLLIPSLSKGQLTGLSDERHTHAERERENIL